MKKKVFNSIFILGLFFLFIIITNVNFGEIYSLPNNFFANEEEISQSNQNKSFGSLIDAKFENQSIDVSGVKREKNIVVFKLFGFIPIRKVEVNTLPSEEVYAGGNPLGITINSSSVIFLQDTLVSTEIGEVESEKSVELKKGDLIYSVDGKAIDGIDEIKEIISNNEKHEIEIAFKRDNQSRKSIIKLVENKEGELKLGILVKDDISGIGTLTFVKKDGSFGALGHPICEENNLIPAKNGNIYDCNLINIDKGEKDSPGQLRCVFLQNKGKEGDVESNEQSGVFGKIDINSNLIDKNIVYKLGGRLSATPGKAKIISSVSGIRQEYDIEIIKANKQSKSNDKSLIIRVTDPKLLQLTGGIVQGMSGSPILQNNKIIGAVTHVFVNDPTKGYGIYSDWML